MSAAAYEFISTVLKKLGDQVEVLAAERDALKLERDELRRERDELRTIIESAGRVLAGEEKNDE